jgi:membrane protein implicated in regulation of membrane protease activity
MAIICYIGGVLVKKANCPVWLTAIIIFVLNAFISPCLLLVWPGCGYAAFAALFLPLAVASAANAAAAAALTYALKKPYTIIFGESLGKKPKTVPKMSDGDER